jgi:predicted nuclease with RNAse H fold
MSGPWAGIDVGGKRKGFHVAVVDEPGGVLGPWRATSVVEAAEQLLTFRPSLTAVDSPIVPAPDGRRFRECERRLRGEVCGIRWTPDRASLEANEGYFGWILHGFELYRALRQAGLGVVECFPTASWTRWSGARSGRSRAVWTRAALPTLALHGVPRRTNQDERDAIAAAVTAREHSLGRTEQFGEIVVPKRR